ncbi:DNA helicase [Rummeliibacillus sp. BSL5]
MEKKIAKTLKRIEEDIENDDLGKARDRLHGLISTFPNELDLRKMLGDIYFKLKYPAMAGRYWYLEKNKTPRMIEACIVFENSMGKDINKIARALKYKGDIEILRGLELDPELLSIQHKVKEKIIEESDEPKEDNHKPVIFGCLSIIILIITFTLVGVYTVFNWIF